MAAVLLLAGLLPVLNPAAAHAVGQYSEVGDAGDVLATASVPAGSGSLGAISGSLSDGADEDVFKVCVTGEFSASAPGGVGGVTPPGATADSTLYLFGATGAGVVSNDDAGPTEAGSNLTGFPVAAGTYYLAISAYDHDPLDPDGNEIFPDEPYEGAKGPNDGIGPLHHWDDFTASGQVGTYTITFTGVSYCSSPAFTESDDAGDTLATANTLAGSGPVTSISGALADGADEDLFQICVTGEFSAAAPGAVDGVTPPGVTADSTLYLFDSTGTGVVSNDDAGPTQAGANLTGFPVAAGNYYLAISAYDHDPLDAEGAEIFPDEPYEGAKGPNDAVGPLDHWDSQTASGQIGTYTISLTGVSYCGGPPAPVVTSLTPTTGPRTGGTSLTITGSGFTGAAQVRVGTADATNLTVDSDTQIIAVSPPRPECPTSPQSVRVVGPNGQSPVNPVAQFTYDTTGCPVVTGLSPTIGLTGTSITISGSSLTGATAVVFNTTPATSYTVDSDTMITAVVPLLAVGTYDVVVLKGQARSTPSSASVYTAAIIPDVEELIPAHGSPLGGSEIGVFGHGFSGVTSVLFGTTPGTILYSNSGQITVKAPALPSNTVVDVRVTTPLGTSLVEPEDRFTFVFQPEPQRILPDSGPAAGGTGATLTGSGFLGATGVHFGNSGITCPQQCNVVSDTEIDLLTPAHTIAGTQVTVDSPDGPSASGPTFAFTGVGAFTPAGICTPSCAASGAVLLPSGKVLAVNGAQANIYDPATGAWTKGAVCNACEGLSTRDFATVTALPTGPPAACGANCGKVLTTGETGAALYDPPSDTWAPIAGGMVSPVTRAYTATLLSSGRVLLASGTKAQFFDPLTATFVATGDLHHARASHAATLLGDGRVLVTGGGGPGIPSGPVSKLAEVFDPATGTWVDTAPMNQSRLAHTSTLLKDGRVLVTGGQIGFFAPITSSEIWNPATGLWSPTANMIFARSDHDVTVLPDGRVLAIGGDQPTEDIFLDTIGHTPTQGELFDPAAQEWLPANPANLALNEEQGLGNLFQVYNNRNVLLPAGPFSVCGSRCGRVLVIRSVDASAATPPAPSAVLFAAPPKATLSAPSSGPTDGGTAVTITGTGLASVSAVTFGGVPAASVTPDPTTPDTKVVAVTPAHSPGAVDVGITTAGGTTVVTGKFTFQAPVVTTTTTTTTTTPTTTAPTTPTTAAVPTPGYALVAADGGVFGFGAAFFGSTGSMRLTKPIVAIEHTPSGRGYWLVGADGGIFAFGDARFFGSTGALPLTRPIVGMRATPSGNGYWLVASDGGIFAFGDARFLGSTGAVRLAGPIVAMERSATGNGYWLAGADGGIFAFGDARFFGSTGAIALARPIVAMARSAAGAGYQLVGADGGIFAFGDAAFRGSTGALRLTSPIVGMASTDGGYWLCAGDGGVFAFGSAPFRGSMGAGRLNQPVVSCSTSRGPQA